MFTFFCQKMMDDAFMFFFLIGPIYIPDVSLHGKWNLLQQKSKF